MSKRVFNFSPGPAVLPVKVLEQAAAAAVGELDGLGMSVLEIGHRSKAFEGILAEAKSLLSELLAIPSGYSILFLQGGSNLQFSMIPMNLLRGTGNTAEYILTGTWGVKAFQEAQREAGAHTAWDGKAHNYSHLPADSELKLDQNAAYAYFTSNETIQGVEFSTEPSTGSIPLVCDASSNFLSRPINVERYGLIYACAQKNAGIAGVTVVIIRDDLLERVPKGLPSMLDFRLLAANDSLLNTPPVFAIYVLLLVARWLQNDVGGLAKMGELNQAKAQLLYAVLDKHPQFYRGHARSDCRSLMNVTFRLPSEELEAAFLKAARARDLVDLKGHRSVGGIRASIYNAMPREGVERLANFMTEFCKEHGAGF